MSKIRLACLATLLAAALAVPAFPQTADVSGPDAAAKGHGGSDLALDKQEAIVTANRDALVIVEYTLKYDKGEAPSTSMARYGDRYGLSSLVDEERPFERAGVLVDGTHVVTDDIDLHPRFIKSIRVRRYDGGADAQRVDATPSAYPRQQDAIILELAAPLQGAKPATFDSKKDGPYALLKMQLADGRWAVGVDSFGRELQVQGKNETMSGPDGLVVDKEGAPVAISTGTDLPAHDEWRGSPMSWPATSAGDMKSLLEKVNAAGAKGIVGATLNFRSPKSNANSLRDRYMQEGQSSTVQHALGVAWDDHTVLILAELKPTTTARLERIRLATDPPMDARFKATLQDYGMIVAETDKPISGAPGISKADVGDLKDVVIPTADILLQGEKRVAYVQPRRISSFTRGFRGILYPDLGIDDSNVFLFDPQGDLMALPVSQRDKTDAQDNFRSQGNTHLMPVAQLAKVMAALPENSDTNNIPRSEDEESRLVYLGVEMQPLTQELARVNGVSDQTQDGETGTLITYVYPDSPAAKAGVQVGWVLLRVDVDGLPKPIDVHMDSDMFADRPFPWDNLDTEPEQYFDQLPSPWPNAENTLTRTLTDLGFGKKFTAEFWHDGKLDKKEFVTQQGPPSYASAPKYKFAPLGITVKDETYEVRRYFQKKADDPGVVISRVEIGSKASVLGLRPYEVITQVNDQPVMNVKDFEKLVAGQTDLRLNVKRMTTGRIEKATLSKTATSAPAAPAGN